MTPLKRKLVIMVSILSLCLSWAKAQNGGLQIKGTVVDSKSMEPIPSAIITLHSVAVDGSLDKTLAYTTSKQDGSFSLKLSATPLAVRCRVRLMGYVEQVVSLTPSMLSNPFTIYLVESAELLPEVVVLSAPIHARGDTISYRASAFITPTTYSAEDLMKKLPGITIDTSGLIRYQGDPIQGVYIEGMDLVSGSYKTVTRIVKAEDIKSVEVMERFQKVKLLRGLEDGKGAMLNIRLKNSEMLHPSGEVGGGIGMLGKKGVWEANDNTLLVNSKVQILAALGVGSTNQTSSNDMRQAQTIPNTSIKSLLRQQLPGDMPSPHSLSHHKATGTMNQLWRLSEDNILKYNLGYEYQKSLRGGGQSATLYNGKDYTSFEDSWSRESKSHLAFISVDYTENSDEKYLKNSLDIQGDYLKENNDLVRDRLPIHEGARVGEIRISDQFSYLKRQEEDLVDIKGWVNYRKMPRAHIGVPSGDFMYQQILRGEELMGRTFFSYGWGLKGAYNIYGNISIEGHYQNGEVLSEPSQLVSYANGGKIFAATAPTLSYEGQRLKWSFAIPLDLLWHHVRYQNFEGQKELYHKVTLYPGANFKISYRPNSYWYWDFSTRYNMKQTESLTDFLLGSYMVSFDSRLTKRDFILPQTSSLTSIFNIKYRRPIQGLFTSLTLSASRNRGNRMNNSILHGTTKESDAVKMDRVGHNAFGNYYLSKQIAALKTLVSISLDYSYFDRPLMIIGQVSQMSAHNISGTLDLNSSPLHWLEINANSRYSQSLLQNKFANNRTEEWLVGGSVTLNLGENFSAKVNHESLFYKQNEEKLPTKSMLGALLSFRQPRYRLELRCDNLLDERSFTRAVSSDADQRIIYDLLRPRQFVLAFTLKY